MKKTLFTINIDNTIDLITNSSSELFILHEDSLETAKEMVEQVYPDYLSEYEELTSLRDSSLDNIRLYIDWVEDSWYDTKPYNYYQMSEKERREYSIKRYIEFANKFDLQPEDIYDNWDNIYKGDYWYANISDSVVKLLADKIDPDGKIFLLRSISENPNWDYQEQLSNIATRYHLG